MVNPEVSLLIDNWKNKIEDYRDVMAMTAIGRAAPMEDFEHSMLLKFRPYFLKV
ncbi:MAG TPA: hypothetical protein VN373_04810 [Methanosarcina barkeri]|jgi:heme iron utilization protein|nr:hypothetical protein [Methanosarcina barkeri]